ncbi:MAG: hypothetical protein IH598_12830 [Bacteroidales bacterium]|nr:hypothetical protein [Bacteroidales bacterium]
MKTIGILLVFLALSFNLLAQPTAITWQGKLLDNSGNAINQNNVAMTFAMFDAETDGNQLWPTTGVVAKVVNVLNGLYSVQLGTGIADDMAFAAEMFEGFTPWLEVKVGTETLPRTEITNVPFALISNDLSAAGWESPGEIGKTTPNTGKFTTLESETIKLTTVAGLGKVLSSDATGIGAWTALPAPPVTSVNGMTGAVTLTKSDVNLGNVENTAISTWAGSANISTVGTITSGTWNGAVIDETYIGNLSTSKITSGTFDNARINWAAPGAIGSTTPATGAFTSLSASNGLSVSGGTVNIKPAGSGGAGGQVLTTDGNGNATWQNSKLANFEESNTWFFPKMIVKLQAVNAFPDVDLVLAPQGLGAILADQPDGTAAGGNIRGMRAVDLQMGRFDATKVASGSYAIIPGGFDNTASGSNSVAIGTTNYATGQNSITIGTVNNASGMLSIAIGWNAVASGYSSKAFGDYLSAPSAYETVLGQYNIDYTPVSTTGWDASDRLFLVGNGTSNVARSNALTILKNANTTIGGSLTINGNGTNTSIAFPTGRGNNGQVLTSNGSGGTSWATPTNGTVTGVTGTLPIVSTGGTAPEISINPATTSTAGSMSAADKTKLDGLKTHTIGESYGGGIVFYVYDGGYHGLIAATTDIGDGTNYYWWNGVYKITGTSGDGLNTGEMNTTLIIASQIADNQIGYFAARVCANYSVTVDGITYGDWYLPSKYELNLLFLQKDIVGGFPIYTSYWSSSEASYDHAWCQYFMGNGDQSSSPKNNTFHVRAIRSF